MAQLLSRRAYAVARNFTEGAVRKAIKAGKIVLTEDGLIDPRQADKSWHRYSRAAARDSEPAPSAVGKPLPIADLSPASGLDDTWLDDADIRRLLATRPSDERIVELLTELKREIMALRKDLVAERPHVPGLADLRHDMASLSIRLSVTAHQLLRAIRGEPVTVAEGVFGPEELIGPLRHRR
jgi:hypothetical protein